MVVEKYGISGGGPFPQGGAILVCAPVSPVSVTAVEVTE